MTKKVNIIVLIALSVGCFDSDLSDQNIILDDNDFNEVDKSLDVDAEFNHPLMPSNRIDSDFIHTPFFGDVREDGFAYGTYDGIINNGSDSSISSTVKKFKTRILDPGELISKNRIPVEGSNGFDSLIDELGVYSGRKRFVLTYKKYQELEPIQVFLDKLISSGLVLSMYDYEYQKDLELERRKQLDLPRKLDFISYVNSISEAGVFGSCEAMPCVFADLSYSELSILSEYNLLDTISLDRPGTTDAPPTACSTDGSFIDGYDITTGHQINQYTNNGWLGKGLKIAMVENQIPLASHNGFYKSYFLGHNRLIGRYDCSSSSGGTWPGCYTPIGSALVTDHPTSVAGLLIGDLTVNQDSSVVGTTEQLSRSGYARQAELYAYGLGVEPLPPLTATPVIIAAIESFDHMINVTKPYLVNASWSVYSDDTKCDGESNLSKSANDLYENGIPVFKTAGNRAPVPTPSSDCTIGSPGSAIGVFTVSSHHKDCASPHYSEQRIGDSDKVRYSDEFTQSWGGNITEGKGRTIIDLSAYDCRGRMFDSSGGYSLAECGTSYASPTIAASATVFAEFYRDTFSYAIDNPGIMYANLLLMGDREIGSQTGGVGKLNVGYQYISGAGRFKMRKWDNAGMDAPFEWATGYTCVDDGKAVKIIDSKTIPADVDFIKAVIWWYDRAHESGNPIDDIDLSLKYTGGPVLIHSSSADDNKERIYYNDNFFTGPIQNKKVDLEIIGNSVSTDVEGCGVDSMMVYYAWMYEDNDRDDSDGPPGPGFPVGIEEE